MTRTALADRPVETEITGRSVLSEGFRRMVRFMLRHRRHDGGWSGMMTRDIHEGAKVAAVIAWDPERDRLVLIRQFRPAAHLATGCGSLVEIVAGGVEDGEAPETAALRELKEETGLVAQAIVPCLEFLPSPGITTEHAFLFLALVDSSALPATAGEDDDEDIEPLAVPVLTTLDAAGRGVFRNGFALLALNWFAGQDRAELRQRLTEAMT